VEFPFGLAQDLCTRDPVSINNPTFYNHWRVTMLTMLLMYPMNHILTPILIQALLPKDRYIVMPIESGDQQV